MTIIICAKRVCVFPALVCAPGKKASCIKIHSLIWLPVCMNIAGDSNVESTCTSVEGY